MDQVRPADAREALSHVYLYHYTSLVRLAAFLASDSTAAEDIAQEAYIRASRGASRYLRDDGGLAYLRTCVVNLCRSQWRHGQVARRVLPALARAHQPHVSDEPLIFNRQIIVQALGTLPSRQREVVVLRHYLGLSERETADTLGITVGSVKSHASRALINLRARMEQQHDA